MHWIWCIVSVVDVDSLRFMIALVNSEEIVFIFIDTFNAF